VTTYAATIVDAAGLAPVFGDHIEIVRSITGLDEAVVITKAWLTLKSGRSLADAGAELQHVITTTETAAGQITDDGTASTTAELTFRIEGADYDGLVATATYHYDIQILLSDDQIATLEVGTVTWEYEITRAQS
jgi:hypothetical protein